MSQTKLLIYQKSKELSEINNKILKKKNPNEQGAFKNIKKM